MLVPCEEGAVESAIGVYELAERFREVRLTLGLSQDRLGRELGVTQSTISCYEIAKQGVDRRTLWALAGIAYSMHYPEVAYRITSILESEVN